MIRLWTNIVGWFRKRKPPAKTVSVLRAPLVRQPRRFPAVRRRTRGVPGAFGGMQARMRNASHHALCPCGSGKVTGVCWNHLNARGG